MVSKTIPGFNAAALPLLGSETIGFVKDGRMGRAALNDIRHQLLNEDDLGSDSDTQAATQRSIKKYMDDQLKVTNDILKNHVSTHSTAANIFSSSSDTHIFYLDTSITPIQANAKINVRFRVSYERNTNGMFYVKRVNPNSSVTEIGSGPGVGSRTPGMVPVTFDNSDSSTMQLAVIDYEDTITQAGVHTYQLWVRGVSASFAFNLTLADSDTTSFERGSSQSFLQELLL